MRPGNSIRSTSDGPAWYFRSVAFWMAGGATWSMPPEISNSGARPGLWKSTFVMPVFALGSDSTPSKNTRFTELMALASHSASDSARVRSLPNV
ncbi:MAG: hypothetical protein K0R99_5048 [Microbacterium sp.]|nr:hypothetical protein [Microbacterium sp.]